MLTILTKLLTDPKILKDTDKSEIKFGSNQINLHNIATMDP